MSRLNNPAMRTTIRLNAELTRRAKRYAAQHDRTFTEVVEEAITNLLANGTKARPRRKITLPVCGDPKKRITHEQYREVIERMYEEEADFIRRGCK
jgi:hypothetical protein